MKIQRAQKKKAKKVIKEYSLKGKASKAHAGQAKGLCRKKV